MFSFFKKSKTRTGSNPVFSGTIEDFNTFFSGFCRNLVQQISKKYKSKIGKCEKCGVSENQLDAAHIHGRERKNIIKQILSNYITHDRIIKIDLKVFKTEFINAHYPIEETIKILCKKCHIEYDSVTNSPKTSDHNEVKTYFQISESWYGQGKKIRVQFNKGIHQHCSFIYDHDEVYKKTIQHLKSISAWNDYGKYSSSNNIPTWAEEYVEQVNRLS